MPDATPPEAELPDATLPGLDELERRLDDPELDLGLDSLMVVRAGRTLYERWWGGCAPDMPHAMYSVTKTVMATAVGIATDEGLLHPDELLAAFFPEHAAAVGDITLRHLLTMSSGRVVVDSNVRALTSAEAVQRFAELEQATAPGSRFAYCSLSSHIAGLALRTRTHMTLLEFVRPRVLAPLGIPAPAWETDLSGNQIGGSGLFLRTGELATLGALFLGGGVYDEHRVFSAAWHSAATAVQISIEPGTDTRPEWLQGYGYQMWRGLNDTYRADGMLGQFAVVAPEHDLVIATTARSQHTDRILDAIGCLLR